MGCDTVYVVTCFEGKYYLHLQGGTITFTLDTERQYVPIKVW
jgi:hypothetical protein